jgi:GWxTD domain-containing protein
LHYTLARIYESWWEDWQDLVALPPEATGGLRCSRVLDPVQGSLPLVAATLAVYCPEAWARIVKDVTPLAGLKREERERMIGHYRLAFDADSSLTDAGVRLLGHLADDGEWDAYDYFSQHLVHSMPTDARAWLFLGLGFHERGRDTDADSAFARGFALLPPADRRVFENIAPLIPRSARARYAALDSGTRARTAAAFLEAEDPLYLTAANERRLEHYARLAWAELKFGMPELGHRGWDTDRGNIWVRYGAPVSAVMCCYGGAESGLDARFVFWSYGPTGPVFTFRKPLVYRSARLTESAQLVADALDATTPEAYRPRTVPAFFPFPHQVVRFRGTTPELTRVEIYAAAPLDSLRTSPGDSLAMGIFVFDAAFTPIWSRRHRVIPWEEPVQVNYSFQVPGGVFHYGIEARRAAPDSIALPVDRARDSVVVRADWSGNLAISDLLVADSIAAAVPTPLGRDNFAIDPSRTLVFASGQAVHLYFELYGLKGDSAGLAHYHVDLAVDDSVHTNVVQRVLRGVTDLFRRAGGQSGPPSIAWDRDVPAGRERFPDYIAVQLPELPAGAYLIRLRVSDKATGQTATAERVFRVAAARKGP